MAQISDGFSAEPLVPRVGVGPAPGHRQSVRLIQRRQEILGRDHGRVNDSCLVLSGRQLFPDLEKGRYPRLEAFEAHGDGYVGRTTPTPA